jgi:DNA-binding transcriptional regulator LsrR (DeoR family)
MRTACEYNEVLRLPQPDSLGASAPRFEALRNSSENQKTLHKILQYYYIDSLTQREVADKLSIPRIKVVRYLNYAREQGLIEIKLNIPVKDTLELESRVEKKYSMRECRIATSYSTEAETCRAMGTELSDLLQRILKKDMYVGVSWSQTFRNTVEYINPEKKTHVNVVPVIGGLELEGANTNSNIIAHIFAEKFGGINYTINIPAVLDSAESREILEHESHTRKIKDLAKKIDVVITGIGDISGDSTALRSGYFTPEEIGYLNSMRIHGIVNLNFIGENGEEITTEIDGRIVKIFPLASFKQCPAVVGVAFGKAKVAPLKAALRGGIINYLITDEDTAKALIA